MNVYLSHSGAFADTENLSQNIYFNKRWTNSQLHVLLLDTKVLCQFLIYREGRIAWSSLFFPWFLLLIPELQKTELPWPLVTLSAVCVLGYTKNFLSFLQYLYYMLLLHVDPFSLSSSRQANSMNKDTLILKQKKIKKIMNTHTSNKRAPNTRSKNWQNWRKKKKNNSWKLQCLIFNTRQTN